MSENLLIRSGSKCRPELFFSLGDYENRNTLDGNVGIRIPRYETLRVTEFGQTVAGGEPPAIRGEAGENMKILDIGVVKAKKEEYWKRRFAYNLFDSDRRF
ncbi:MAG: hypothetical protein IH802_10410 [Nitrospinae bacterium]|nr:hypothetical protein [Nitrospinota bacterium]